MGKFTISVIPLKMVEATEISHLTERPHLSGRFSHIEPKEKYSSAARQKDGQRISFWMIGTQAVFDDAGEFVIRLTLQF